MTTPANTALIHSLLSGMTPKDCAAKHHCTIANVHDCRRNLIRQGLLSDVIIKSTERRSKHYDEIVRLYLDNVSIHQITLTLKIRRNIVENQIRIYKELKKLGVVTESSQQWRCKKHDSPTCWWCWHKEVTGDYPKEPCLDYISSNLI